MDGTQHAPAAEWLRLAQNVSHCGRQLRRALGECVAARGLTDTDCLILWACCEAPPEGQAQHELATQVGVSPAQLSGLVEQLGARGWIVGRRPAHDRRRQYWRLTPVGQTLVEQMLGDIERWITSLGCEPEKPQALLERVTSLATTLSHASQRAAKEAA
jgi:DNA-binding MarR family transcriptional regulator